MRKRDSSGGVTLQAIAGNNAVFLGFDLDAAARKGCLGFALHREDHTEGEQYWLSSFKTFQSVVPHPSPDHQYSTLDHPIQSFYWGDYSAKPKHTYTYRLVPRYGTPKNLTSKTGVEASVTVSTSDPTRGTHGVYFNRGVAASQAYARKFGKKPDQLSPEKRDEAFAWLSRGLLGAILTFIGQATSSGFALRAAVYEFTQADVLTKFKEAHANGADVKIVYHAKGDDTGDGNRAAIATAKLPRSMLIERTNAPIAHNKFIVLCRKSDAGALTPVAVWTGSTNFSEGGIFGHSNVGHAVRDRAVAGRYLEFWDELSADPEPKALRDWVAANSPFDADAVSANGVHTLFSPRHGNAPLGWYAQEFGGPASSAHITLPFGMGTDFEDTVRDYAGPALHYVMLDKRDNHQSQWDKSPTTIVAVGAKGGPSPLHRWAAEQLTGFNPRVPYLHTKILLVDPLSSSPTLISGSANFSPASTSSNDENMLVMHDDPEVVDVYLTEYARIFNHFYARFWASELSKESGSRETTSFLDETAGWQKPYFAAGNPKQLQRTLFGSKVQGNS
jgi:phosphatidylserine/phosphatidylglycerophosphate/cardiolipin synthase-like enzyme